MSSNIFLIDLDATITKDEILPMLAKEMGCFATMEKETAAAMMGNRPFAQSFAMRVQLLQALPVSRARQLIAAMPVHEQLADFLRQNRHRCYIATGNVDLWIEDLLLRLGMQGRCFSSKGVMANDRLLRLESILNKADLAAKFPDGFVAVGDGHNDAALIAAATIGIGFGAAGPIAPSVLQACQHAIYTEPQLCSLLNSLL